MMNNPTIKLNFGKNLLLNDAAENGYIETLERLLKLKKKLDLNPSDLYNRALLMAIKNHHLDAVNLLLKYGVDPSYMKNSALKMACDSDDPAIMKRLLDDSRVDPTAVKNRAFIKSCEKGWFDILKILLRRIDLNAVDVDTKRSAFQTAAANGHFQIVEFLFSLPKDSGISEGVDVAFMKAAENGHLKIVKLLLSEKGINASVDDNFAFRKAAENGHYEVVDFLLSLPFGIDPSANFNWALRYSMLNGHYKVAKKLLSLPLSFGIDPSVDNYFAARTLCYNEPLRKELDNNPNFIQDQEVQDERSELALILLSRVSSENAAKKRFMECVRSNQKISPYEMENILI